jgi:hypothetical protein
VAGSLSFFVRRKSGRRGLWVAALAVSGGRVWAMSFIWLLIGCFIFILSFCIFIKIMRCQLGIGGQKSLLLRHDRMAASLKENISNLQKQVLKPNWSTKLIANSLSLSVSLCVCKSSDISSSFYFLRIRFFLFPNLLFPFFSLFLGSSLYLTLLETSKTTKKKK